MISGRDSQDATSHDQLIAPVSGKICDSDLGKLRIGIISELTGPGNDPATETAFFSAVDAFRSMGATVEQVTLPEIKYSVAMYYLIATAEASSNLSRFDGIRFGCRAHSDGNQSLKDLYLDSRSQGFGREVKQRIMLGTFALSSGYYDAYYGKALAARDVLRQSVKKLFNNYDILISPTSPTPAFKIGEKISDPLAMYLSDIGTLAANLAGIPAVSVPCGMAPGNLPIGLQLMAPWNKEGALLGVANKFEQLTGWTDRYKPDV